MNALTDVDQTWGDLLELINFCFDAKPDVAVAD